MHNMLAYQLNNVQQLITYIKMRYPDEQLRFAAAATILETRLSQPIGWSWRRLFQRRGATVFTNQRIVLISSFFSLYTLIYLSLIVLLIAQYTTTTNLMYLFVGLLLVPFVLQRLPYYHDISLQTIQSWQLQTVQGISATGALLTLALSSRMVHIVTSGTLTHEFLETLLGQPEARQ